MVVLAYEPPTFSATPFFADQVGKGTAANGIEAESWASGGPHGGVRVTLYRSSATHVLSVLGQRHSASRVAYYFPRTVGDYHFGEHHPMKPHRLTLTNHLVLGYGLHRYMGIYSPRHATAQELQTFHDEEYIDFLARVTPDNMTSPRLIEALKRFNMNDDCPVFDNMFDFFKQYSGASLAAARRLNSGDADITINWSGGLHHAKKSKADGFCYINDIVLAILELLRIHNRVLYIDIDIHHGDGVQEAFYDSNRVLTVSFHKYADGFFPGTGREDENGHQLGQHFSLNIPLSDGIDDHSYVSLFKAVMEPTIASFRPDVIVLQCGADSLGCDRLGAFNLSIKAHGECVRFIKTFNIPLMILGGGGYTIKNVSRCWTYETAVLVDAQQEISDALPVTAFHDFFHPDYRLHPPIVSKTENHNTRSSLEKLRADTLDRLRFMHGAPSVQMQEIPPSLASWLQDDEDKRGINRKEKAEPDVDMPPPTTPASVTQPGLRTSFGRRTSTPAVRGAEPKTVGSRAKGVGPPKRVRGAGKSRGSGKMLAPKVPVKAPGDPEDPTVVPADTSMESETTLQVIEEQAQDMVDEPAELEPPAEVDSSMEATMDVVPP